MTKVYFETFQSLWLTNIVILTKTFIKLVYLKPTKYNIKCSEYRSIHDHQISMTHLTHNITLSFFLYFFNYRHCIIKSPWIYRPTRMCYLKIVYKTISCPHWPIYEKEVYFPTQWKSIYAFQNWMVVKSPFSNANSPLQLCLHWLLFPRRNQHTLPCGSGGVQNFVI